MNILKFFSKRCLGIDIGAFSIKIIELSMLGKKKRLENYIKFTFPLKDPSLKLFHKENLNLLSEKASNVLNAILQKAGIKEKNAAFALPDFCSFITSFELPPMNEKEVAQAVEFEARHHIPLPLSEVTFDWQIIEKEEIASELKLKILLVAIPNKVLWDYQKMVNLTQIELKGMEAEIFALIRACIPESLEQKPVGLVDIGWKSTTVSIVENKVLKASHSFDISSNTLTKILSSSLKVDLDQAEKLKTKYGLDPNRKDVQKILIPEINSLAFEIDKVCQNFNQNENRKIDNIILSGGTANLFGLKEYLEVKLKKQVQIANPFGNFSSPPILQHRLKELNPSFAIAAGVALMGVEL